MEIEKTIQKIIRLNKNLAEQLHQYNASKKKSDITEISKRIEYILEELEFYVRKLTDLLSRNNYKT